MEGIQAFEMQKPRAVLLYRASTKKQTDSENDIPLQRNILKPWAERNGYAFVKELVEGGVSGFKVSADDRDAIQEIKRMADRREFDILGIYMSDRLGRIAAETPLIVSYLNARSIKVISYTEGEITANTHADKLMTYIRYWQAEGESLKTSARVTDALEQNVRQGKWRGGTSPYGYRHVSRGTLNFKGEPIFDVEINPEQAEVVRTVFRLYTQEHYGSKLIAKYLNNKGYRSKEGGLWDAKKVIKILSNKQYFGVYELGKLKKSREYVASPVMEHLVIISEEEFNAAQAILKSNTRLPNGTQRPTRHGTLLFTGLLYCGECEKKFTSMFSGAGKVVKDDGIVTYYPHRYYRCQSYHTPIDRKETCHQRGYRADILEAQIVADAKNFLTTLDKEKLMRSSEDKLRDKETELAERLKKLTREVSQKTREITKLKDEVMKVVLGESQFSQALLTEMIQTKESELTELCKSQQVAQAAAADLAAMIAEQRAVCNEIDTWAERFDAQETGDKKQMLLNIIERVTITDDEVETTYKIKITTSSGDSTSLTDKNSCVVPDCVKGCPPSGRQGNTKLRKIKNTKLRKIKNVGFRSFAFYRSFVVALHFSFRLWDTYGFGYDEKCW